MQLTKQESLRIMQLWNDYGSWLEDVFKRMVSEYEKEMSPNTGDMWFNARQNVEYFAKKQALIDFKKILSSRYE